MEVAPSAPAPSPDASARAASFEGDPRKWWALAVLLLAQVMIILDIAIVNVAVPSAQVDLNIARADVQWVVTAYLLPFGGLLLLGGRVADYSGRKRVFCIATIGFAIASAIGGAANTEEVLFAARAFQGLFAAAMAPALLSMITLGFPSGDDRTRAFSLYGGVSAAGGAIGLVIGGLLTEYLSWRWSLLINVPISLIVVTAAIPLLRDSRAAGHPRYDVGGAAIGTLSLLCVIYAITNAPEEGWGATSTLGILGAGVVLMAVFLVWETRVKDPLLPLPILLDRNRAGGFLTLAVLYGPPTGMTLLVLLFLQGPLEEGALTAGLYFTPIPICAMFGALASMQLLPRVSPRLIIAVGSVLAAGGMVALTRIGLDATFAGEMLPGFALIGLGTSIMFIAGNAIALSGVPDRDTGLASAVVNTMQQVGAALGVAILSAVAANASADYLTEHGPSSAADAIVHGNNIAFVLGAGLVLAAGLIAALLIRDDTPVLAPSAAPPDLAPPHAPVEPEPAVVAGPVAVAAVVNGPGSATAGVNGADRAPVRDPGDEWVPMAERRARKMPRGPGDRPSGNGTRPPGGESAGETAEDLLGLALSTGRGAAGAALRVGIGASGRAIGLGRELGGGLIRRVERRL